VPSTLDSAATQIGEVEVSGGIGDGAWNLDLEELGLNQLLGSILPNLSGKTFRFCSGAKGSETLLRLGVQPPASPSPTPQPPHHRKRKR
jgi:hypothetical protein